MQKVEGSSPFSRFFFYLQQEPRNAGLLTF
jgi:hypothetical protein